MIVSELQQAHCVALPTETVYGLAAAGNNDLSVSSVYAVKNRPSFNPLILHGGSIDMLSEYAEFSPLALKLADRYWPGPLTLVLKATEKTSKLARAGLETVAVRVPQHPAFRAVLNLFGAPLVAPSANPSNYLSATTAADVKLGFDQFSLENDGVQKELLILEGGRCEYGVESTILDMSHGEPALLRYGATTCEDLQIILPHLEKASSERVTAPGQLKSHYSPHFPLRINADGPMEDEVWIAFGEDNARSNAFTPCGFDANLSHSGSLQEAAANLFPLLHALDTRFCRANKPFNGVAVAKIPQQGLGMAINDRLERAATK